MNLNGYLYTINKNNSFKLDNDELKDVTQEINIFLMNKSYNDLLIKKTVLSHYQRAVKSKIKRSEIAQNLTVNDFESENDINDVDIKEKRLNALKTLSLNDKQKKIVSLLIEGYTYPEIRKRLKMNSDKLKAHVKRIRKSI